MSLRNFKLTCLIVFISSFAISNFATARGATTVQLMELEDLYLSPINSYFKELGPRLLANNAKEITEEIAHDLPAIHIGNHDRELINEWKQILPEKDTAYYDIDALFELNVKAIKLWKKILRCNGKGRLKAEYARVAYAKGEDFCIEDFKEYDSDDIVDELKTFHQEVRSFLLNSRIRHPRIHSLIDPNTSPLKQFRSVEEYNNRKHILPHFHPLLVQVILDFFVKHYHFTELYFIHNRSVGDRIGDLFSTIIDKNNIRYYEKYGQRSRDFNVFLISLSRNLSYEEARKHFTPSFEIDDDEKERGLILHNSLFLLSHLSIGSCRDWGLWPGLSLGMSFSTGYEKPQYSFWHFPAEILSFLIVSSCGAPEQEKLVHDEGNHYVLAPTKFYRGYHSELSFMGHSFTYRDIKLELISKLREIAENYL